VADKGHDSDAFVEMVEARGSLALIPPLLNRKNPISYDIHMYGAGYLMEVFFSRLKHFQEVVPRSEGLADIFLATVHMACGMLWRR